MRLSQLFSAFGNLEDSQICSRIEPNISLVTVPANYLLPNYCLSYNDDILLMLRDIIVSLLGFTGDVIVCEDNMFKVRPGFDKLSQSEQVSFYSNVCCTHH